MKHPTSNIQHPILWLLALLLAVSAHAELTAIVSPGYQFGETEKATASKLNRLGLPTITITGTLDGTNAGISAGSINGNMFSSTVVDNATIYLTNSSPQALAIKAAGVGVREISSAIAGPGLTGGSGGPLTNNVDGITLVITNDVVTLGTNSPAFINVASNSVVVGSTNNQGYAMPVYEFWTNLVPQVTFVTTPVALSGVTPPTLAVNQAHGLGVTPRFLNTVIVCTAADVGYAVGDEVPIENVWRSGNVAGKPGTAWANSTNVGFTLQLAPALWQFANKTNGAQATPDGSKWSLKIYALP